MRIKDIGDKAYTHAVAAGFATGRNYHDPTQVSSMLMLAVSELAEALEEIRTHGATFAAISTIRLENGKPEGYVVEIADAVIRLLEMCRGQGLDLESAIKVKMEYNLTRPKMHGGKKI